MLTTSLGLAALDRAPVVVCLSAHPDDLEIAAGGTVLRLVAEHPSVQLVSVVLTGEGPRHDEVHDAFKAFTDGRGRLHTGTLRDGFLPADWGAAKELVREATEGLRPDLVLAPSLQDGHQDHRLVGELAWQLFRDSLILQYEIPKWDGDLGRPNAYVALDEDVVARKVELLLTHFPSQRQKPWYEAEVFRGLLRLRGLECARPYAEAFTARKLLLHP